MTPTGTMDADDFGVFSPSWMLRNSLAHVPHGSLYRGIIAVLDYLENSDDIEIANIFDVLAQVSLTGKYVPTEFKGQIVGYLEVDEGDDGNPISKDDIQQFLNEINGTPDGRNPKDDGKTPFTA